MFTTAAFAVIMLGRNISSTKWRALILLVIGCVLVASPAFNKCDDTIKNETETAIVKPSSNLETLFGVAAVLAMVTVSGYSAIYFESMLKKVGEKITIWERNFQLAFYSIFFLILVLSYEIQSNYVPETNISIFSDLFSGWTINTVMIALIQALGGLLVAASLKYADAVLKTLATSGAIVLSTFLGWFLLGGNLDSFVIIGCISTILAICNYTLDSS